MHIKGYLRDRDRGRLVADHRRGRLVVEGPGDLVWRYPLEPSAAGSVYWKFDEADLPTGTYRAHFERAADPGHRRRGVVSQGGLPPAALRGSPRFAGARAARSTVRRRTPRHLLRRWPRRGAPDRVASDPVPLRMDAGLAAGIPVLLRRALLARPRLRVDAGSPKGGLDRRGRRRDAAAQSDDRTHRPAAHLRGRGDGDRRRRSDGERDASGRGAAAVPPRPQGAALSRAPGRLGAATDRARPGRQAAGRRSGDRAAEAPSLALLPARLGLHRRRGALRHRGGRRAGVGDRRPERRRRRSGCRWRRGSPASPGSTWSSSKRTTAWAAPRL